MQEEPLKQPRPPEEEPQPQGEVKICYFCGKKIAVFPYKCSACGNDSIFVNEG